MTRLSIERPNPASVEAQVFSEDSMRRIDAFPAGNCPIDQNLAYLRVSQAQSCGKCTPCRVGVPKMASLIEGVLHGAGNAADLEELATLATAVYQSADCAIGYEAGKCVENGLVAFGAEYAAHVETGKCPSKFASVPCVSACPAHVDVPSYIALAEEGRFVDAIRVIRNNNPFPSVCAYICEHPCESHCRRNIVDAAINIRGIKKYVVDNVGACEVPSKLEPTGRSVGIIGGGPSGLTAAYYLSLMGHEVTVYEQNQQLGGMLLFGIPRYRLPQDALDFDLDAILSTGVKVELGVKVGDDVRIEDVFGKHDASYVAIGAHSFKNIGIEGEDLEGVYSAVEILHDSSGLGDPIDMAGKDVVVIGGGNVAMDALRTAKRLGASSVKCVYRRRQEDMTALAAEVEAAIAEGCELMTLLAPVSISKGAEKPLVLKVQPQIPGVYADGRPRPFAAQASELEISCDIIVAAIGQDIESEAFASAGLETNRARIASGANTVVEGQEGVFSGGDCSAGPETVIRAIEAGKVAAANIDEYLGFSHVVHDEVEVPRAKFKSGKQVGRVNVGERLSLERVTDFGGVELPVEKEAAVQECGRCLRCDHFGYQAIRERGSRSW